MSPLSYIAQLRYGRANYRAAALLVVHGASSFWRLARTVGKFVVGKLALGSRLVYLRCALTITRILFKVGTDLGVHTTQQMKYESRYEDSDDILALFRTGALDIVQRGLLHRSRRLV